MTLDDWFSEYFKNIRSIARGYTQDWGDLISLYYLYLKKSGWAKVHKGEVVPFSQLNEDKKSKLTRKWMKSNSKWDNVDFCEMRVNDLSEEMTQIEDVEFEDPMDILIGAEDINDSVKEWIEDITRRYGEHRANKLIEVRYHYLNSLTLPEKVLYDLTYTQEMTTRSVAKKLGIPHTSCYLMVRDLNNKLKLLCGTISLA